MPYTLHSRQFVPKPLPEVFPFYADARNLQELTPKFLDFKILTETDLTMRAGLIIDYRIGLHGIPMKWRTEITAWEPMHRFIDEQRKGPYTLWRHEHTFVEENGGTWVIDRVDYDMIFGFMVEGVLVRPELKKIFGYRGERLQQLFNAGPQTLSFEG
jgi:ligand-binding SRPBCC domain-containing protein